MSKTPRKLLGSRSSVFVKCPEGTFNFPNEHTTRGTIDRNCSEISFTPLIVKENGQILYQNNLYIDQIESLYGSMEIFQEDRELQIREIESKGYTN